MLCTLYRVIFLPQVMLYFRENKYFLLYIFLYKRHSIFVRNLNIFIIFPKVKVNFYFKTEPI